MGFFRKFFSLLVFFVIASISYGQSWKIITPRQVLPVPSDGSTVAFPNVNLVSGMKYRVHATQSVKVSNGSDFADAAYYITPIGIAAAPTFIPVSLKVRTDATNEDWFYNFWKTSGFQAFAYQPSHTYDASIASLGSPLSFRF